MYICYASLRLFNSECLYSASAIAEFTTAMHTRYPLRCLQGRKKLDPTHNKAEPIAKTALFSENVYATGKTTACDLSNSMGCDNSGASDDAKNNSLLK